MSTESCDEFLTWDEVSGTYGYSACAINTLEEFIATFGDDEESSIDLNTDNTNNTIITININNNIQHCNNNNNIIMEGLISLLGEETSLDLNKNTTNSTINNNIQDDCNNNNTIITEDLSSLLDDSFITTMNQYVFNSYQASNPFSTKATNTNDDNNTDKNVWKVTVVQARPKKQEEEATYNFNTYFRVTVALNGKLVNFRPTNIGFIDTEGMITMFDKAHLPEKSITCFPSNYTLSWDKFGSKCYNQRRIGNYLVVLEVKTATEQILNVGLVVSVTRTNQEGSSSSFDYPVTGYTWFEMDNVESFVDETNLPQLLSLWSENLEHEDNCVDTNISCPDRKVIPRQVTSRREKRKITSAKRKNMDSNDDQDNVTSSKKKK